METIMNDNDSKTFLKDMTRLYPEYKNDFGAVSNLIVLLMEELQKERKGRKRGEKLKVENTELKKYKTIWKELKTMSYPCYICGHAEPLKKPLEKLEQKHFPRKEKNENNRNTIKKNTT